LLTVGNSDTTLPLQYVNGFKKNMNQYETPFTKHGDTTFVLYLRVNMQGWQAFNPAAHKVGVRGSNAVDWGQTGELGWGSSAILTQEQPHPNLGSRQYDAANLYSVAIHVPNKYRGAAAEFKFVIHNLTSPNNEDWGQMVANPGPQVRVGLPLVGDTTIYWMWFANQPFIPGTGKDTSTVTFRADMAKAVDEFGYTLGDSLRVDGGFQGTAETVIRTYMQPEGLFTTVYKATSTFTKVTIGANVNYQYYTVKNGIEYREIFFDFTYKGTDVTQAERRKTKIEGKVYTVNDTIVSISDLHRVPRFRNQTKLTKNVTVKLTCDLRPAIWQIKVGKDTLKDIQSGINVMVADSVLKWGLAINGPATGRWASWGTSLKADTTRKMYDDGTHGDVKSNDTVFTWTKTFTTADIKGQEFKFGIGGGDNEGGYGNNHIENISDAATTFTLATQWGSIDPLFYDTWDYELKKPKPTGVEVARSGIPVEFTLDQNFPNPFNPATVIQYSIPKESQVTLKIYNMLGQEVMTLVNEQQKAGYYKFTLNASKLASGVYFYQVVADKYVATKKMLLLK
jgi:hypothetical protein